MLMVELLDGKDRVRPACLLSCSLTLDPTGPHEITAEYTAEAAGKKRGHPSTIIVTPTVLGYALFRRPGPRRFAGKSTWNPHVLVPAAFPLQGCGKADDDQRKAGDRDEAAR